MITYPIGFFASGLDADATAYIEAINDAGGTVSSTVQDGIYSMFTNLKAAGLYNKLWAMWPIIGGNADSHKINAINPGTRDLTFSGGWTHNSNGALANGTDAYAATGYVVKDNYGLTGTAWGWYNTNPVNPTGEAYIGSIYNTSPQRWASVQRSSGRLDWGANSRGNITYAVNQLGSTIISGGYPTGYVSWTIDDTYQGSGILDTDPVYADNPYEQYLGAMNLNGSAYGFVADRYVFAFISQTLTQSEQYDMQDQINGINSVQNRNTY
jgi:hypothetical protein